MPLYPGAGKAALLKCNTQGFLLNNETIAAAGQTIAFMLERPRDAYPWGAAFQLKCSASPGGFEVDIMGSETDESAGSYVQLGTTSIINSVNSSNFGRYDMPNTLFPRFVCAVFKTWPNAGVSVTLVITR